MTLGTVTHFDDHATVRFERHLGCDVDTLWSALTDVEQLAGWLAPATMHPVPGGSLAFDFGADQKVEGTISVLEAPTTLEYTWTFTGEPDSVLRFELTSAETGTDLVLEHRLLPNEQAVGYGAGWHAHLDMLAAQIAGEPAIDWDERFGEVYPIYAGA